MVDNGDVSGLPTQRVRDRPVMRTGWFDDQPTFGGISCGAIRPDGAVAVFDDRADLLYLIDRQGNASTAGGPGQGPGEFESCGGLALLADSTLIVYDYMARRLSLFGAAGEFLDSRSWDLPGIFSYSPSGVTAAGRLAWVPSSYSPSAARALEGRWLTAPLVTTAPLGGNADTVHLVPAVRLRLADGRPVPDGDPFVRYGTGEAHSGGYVWATNDNPQVTWIGPAGSLRQIARWQAPAPAADEEAWERYEAAYYERMGGSPERGSESQMAQRLRRQREAASATLPYFRFVHSGADGSAWLSEYTMFGMPARRFLRFGSTGVVVGWIEFPRPLQILDIAYEHVLGVETDEWGVEAVVLYRVR